MFFRIEKKIISATEGVYTGVVVAYGLDNNSVGVGTNDLLQSVVDNSVEALENINIHTLEELNLYRNAMHELGINPAKYPSSIEAILSRIKKSGSFPSISPVVDLGNYISIKHHIPVGVHDIDTLDGSLNVRLATIEDCSNPENQFPEDKLVEGEPIYATANSVRTRRWLWRQTPAGRVTNESKNFIFPIDGFESNKETVNNAVNELASLIEKLFGVKAETFIITKDESEVRFGPMTKEEKEIEEQVSIMLKGVEQHTTIPQIREKIILARDEHRPLRIKLGLDPSAPDIHIGHAVVLRKIRQLQELGHTAVIIIGDFTGMIGDPSGKSKTRKQLSHEDVVRNAETYLDQIFKIIDRDRTEVYYNSEWLSKMTFKDVIELSSKCTVARMLERDDFNNRYTNHLPLSVHEFFYPLMQAYDSVAIKADIEIGGTDQTFNVLMGRNIQRDYGQNPQLTLFMPLLEGIDGVEKMSKSLNNYVGIYEAPEIIYEKVMKIPDFLILKYYNLCTDVHPDKIQAIKESMENGANPRDIKMQLAYVITGLYCGEDAANRAEEHFKTVFQKKTMPDDAPVIKVDKKSDVPYGEQIVSALVESGFYKSKSEVKRIFVQGGAQLDGVKVTDTKNVGTLSSNAELKMGKNKFFKILVE